jgi:hypothetical protein
VGDEVLLKNLRRSDRKGGWSMSPWKGPYLIKQIYPNNTCTLINSNKVQLKSKQHISNLKLFRRRNLEFKLDSVNDQNDIEIIENCDQVEGSNMDWDGGPERTFRPVGILWQKQKCAEFKIKLRKVENEFSETNGERKLGAPSKVSKMIGDGNCWFRVVSYAITGSQSSHKYFRKLITEFMKSTNMKNKVEGYTKVKNYTSKSKMEVLGTWATDCEILVTSAFLGTDIYVYSRKRDNVFTWQKFPVSAFGNRSHASEKHIYACNMSGVHYDLVLDVDSE